MVLVIPDVHGREFWREPCSHLERYDKVIFLGDYLDPYRFDYRPGNTLLAVFNDIVSLAEAHRDKVTLLLGNHDLHYIDNSHGFATRYNNIIAKDVGPVLREKRDLFKVACEHCGVLYTHAGCRQAWLDEVVERWPELHLTMSADSLNTLLAGDIDDIGLQALHMVSSIRGGLNRNGSCMWADVSEHFGVKSPVTQVFGHTQQVAHDPVSYKIKYRDEVVRPDDNFLMLDCAHAFELDDNNPFVYTRLPNPAIDGTIDEE